MPTLCAIRKSYTLKNGRRVIEGYRGVIGEYVTDLCPTPNAAHLAGIQFAWAALRDDYTPFLLHVRGLYALVFRKPDGWYYSPPRETAELEPGVKTYGQGSYPTIHAAIDAAKFHLAQNAYTAELSLDECQELIDYGGDGIREWIAWQRGYEHLRKLHNADWYAREHAPEFAKSFLIALEAPRV